MTRFAHGIEGVSRPRGPVLHDRDDRRLVHPLIALAVVAVLLAAWLGERRLGPLSDDEQTPS